MFTRSIPGTERHAEVVTRQIGATIGSLLSLYGYGSILNSEPQSAPRSIAVMGAILGTVTLGSTIASEMQSRREVNRNVAAFHDQIKAYSDAQSAQTLGSEIKIYDQDEEI
jgi:Na+/melibiose symporter-like transporter